VDGVELKLSASAAGADWLLRWASPRQVQVTSRSSGDPKVGWPSIGLPLATTHGRYFLESSFGPLDRFWSVWPPSSEWRTIHPEPG